ncbi:MAG TPA: thioesterase family protein [Gaiellaceae bacterium]|nr:thioesterase family protein [Gaiellaceae bacterium]
MRGATPLLRIHRFDFARRLLYELRIPTRWPDFDALGHLNHAACVTYFDEARDHALRETVGDFDTWPNVVAHVDVDYRREVRLGVREILVRTRIVDVGRTSVSFEQALLGEDGEAAVEAETVLVAWDPETRRSRAITEAERAALLAG